MRERIKQIKKERKSIVRMRSTFGCRKTIKLSEEPNTIKIHASALCHVVNFKQRIRSRYVE
ncbi:hypothetical protein HanXRQr2_Chr16g0736371 [Helianthus annuus]|uniref:Uncharacterized protein n=1 Tax=Helianthus annuus TaxID=4232 RepID=A0A251RXY9_HELAN|nr:hypothetical protein HanXRQr2_Chr16g0736371 [Helianthus annuus]